MKSLHRLYKEGSAGFYILTFAVAAVGTATAVAWPAIFADRPAPARTIVTSAKKTVDDKSSSKKGTVLLHAGISGSVEAVDYDKMHQWLQ